MPLEDKEWAVKRFKPHQRRLDYVISANYYDGNTPMAFATAKFRSAFFDVFGKYSENLCAPIIDALSDRLRVTGFRSNKAEITEESVVSTVTVPNVTLPTRKRVKITDPPGERAWEIWTQNRMDLRSQEVHTESLLTGDGYVIVWPDEKMFPTIWPQIADEIEIEYDANTQGKIRRGAKMWFDPYASRYRLNVFLENVIEKYISRETKANPPETAGGWAELERVRNPYGRVPIFHFPNKVENKHGISELRDAVPIQDGLNKAVVDMMVAMEFAAYKQRYIIGHEEEVDPDTGEPVDENSKNYGVDRMMAIPDPEAKVGQFDATDLTQFLKVQDKYWLSAARVTGTPLHYFYITQGDFPSGEAIKSAEGRFIKKITDRQTANGNQWEDVLKFCFQILNELTDDLTFSTMWADATPRSDAEIADTAVKKKAVKVPSSQLQREMGYSEEEIDRNIEEAEAEQAMSAALKMSQDQNQPGESRETTRGRQGVEGG